jgi:hypothetical protein
MGIPTIEVGYTSATTGRGDYEVYKGHVLALVWEKKKMLNAPVDKRVCRGNLTEFLYDERTPIPALLGTVKRLTYGLFGL